MAKRQNPQEMHGGRVGKEADRHVFILGLQDRVLQATICFFRSWVRIGLGLRLGSV